ncbi:MAG TPA: hypothetical protein DCM54_04450 [Gammaproteobacteria bacterium]|nr:hypothetical protein [Gammaproteobacteria bacterium]
MDLPALRAEYLAERKEALESLAVPLREKGLNVETRAIWGHPGYEMIINAASGMDLVIVDTRRHAALSRLFLTNDDWQMVRCCPVPLLLVKEKLWKEKPTILAAVDPMHTRHKPTGLDHKILRVSDEVAKLLDGEVFAVHSYSQVLLSGAYLKDAKTQHETAFKELLADFDISSSRQHLIEEAPEFGLQQIGQDVTADLVVMGGISLSFVTDIFIGNTTEKVLDYIECDVLVLKPDGFKSPINSEKQG